MKLKDLIRIQPLHLFFFPALFVINHFISVVVPEEVLTGQSFFIMSLSFIGAMILCIAPPYIFFKVLSRKFDTIKSSILTTLLFLPFFFFQDFFLSTEELMVGVRLRWLIPALVIVLILLFYMLWKVKRSFFLLNESLNVSSFLLIIYVSITLVLSFDNLKPQSFNFQPKVYDLRCEDCPDIYFLLLDSYTSNKSLRDYFAYDNSSFTNDLSKLGFKVADQTISPYPTTGKCIASILNLHQVKDLNLYDNSFGVNELIKINSVTKSLQKIGYKIENYSLFDVDDQPKYYSLQPSFGVRSLNGVFQNSMLGMGFRFYQDQNFYDLHADILNKIRTHSLNDKVRSFIYGHIMAPHPPFVIDSTGNRIDFLKRGRHRINASSYVVQLQGLNDLVLQTVREVLENSPKSIFIIMGDHGYRFVGKKDEAFTVFLAYKGPNNKDISSLSYSSEIFELVFKQFNAIHNSNQ